MKTITFSLIALSILFSSFMQTQPGVKASIERGKAVYESYCLACHQADGAGIASLAPPLAKMKWVTGDKKKLAKIVLAGLPGGEIEVNGEKFHNPMPPQAGVLKDQEIADVLTYIRNSFGNKASLVSAAEVKAVRATIK